MKYRKRPDVVEATQWFTNGDHPRDGRDVFDGELLEGNVVRYFRRPDVSGDQACPRCDRTFHHHGWIDSGGAGQTVCPGDFIITTALGYVVMEQAAFHALYTKDRE